MFAVENTRVKLEMQPGVVGSDYINANYLDVSTFLSTVWGLHTWSWFDVLLTRRTPRRTHGNRSLLPALKEKSALVVKSCCNTFLLKLSHSVLHP